MKFARTSTQMYVVLWSSKQEEVMSISSPSYMMYLIMYT